MSKIESSKFKLTEGLLDGVIEARCGGGRGFGFSAGHTRLGGGAAFAATFLGDRGDGGSVRGGGFARGGGSVRGGGGDSVRGGGGLVRGGGDSVCGGRDSVRGGGGSVRGGGDSVRGGDGSVRGGGFAQGGGCSARGAFSALKISNSSGH